MNKRFFIGMAAVLTLFPVILSAQDGEIDNLRFSMTIKDLTELTATELDAMASSGDWLLLDGSIAGMTLYSADSEEYLLDVLLMQGEWIGLDQVKKYDCHLVFQGDRWRDIIPSSTPRNPVAGQILLNDKVLVLARVLGYDIVDSAVVPYLTVEKIRSLP